MYVLTSHLTKSYYFCMMIYFGQDLKWLHKLKQHRSQIGSYNCLHCSMKVVYYIFTSTPGVVRIHFQTNPRIVFEKISFFHFVVLISDRLLDIPTDISDPRVAFASEKLYKSILQKSFKNVFGSNSIPTTMSVCLFIHQSSILVKISSWLTIHIRYIHY